MEENQHATIPASVFERIYQENPDPWHYTSSLYEQTKYRVTLAVLPQETYRHALEIGCSIGVMTELLAARCTSLLAIDYSSVALTYAKKRCAHLGHITFAQRSIPQDFPAETFDLILLSEVGFYWSREDLVAAHTLITSHLRPHGHLLLVHWIVPCEGHPLTADKVHEQFFQPIGIPLEHVMHLHSETGKDGYRLDLFQRT